MDWIQWIGARGAKLLMMLQAMKTKTFPEADRDLVHEVGKVVDQVENDAGNDALDNAQQVPEEVANLVD
jgi:hypothetical protein